MERLEALRASHGFERNWSMLYCTKCWARENRLTASQALYNISCYDTLLDPAC